MTKSESADGRVTDFEHDAFESSDQGDMFGTPAPKVYVPEPQHVRNRLESMLSQLKGARTWPWEPVMVRLHRDRNIPYLCGLLPAEEADRWRAKFDAEMARLERDEAA
jgi:hypothetical protein